MTDLETTLATLQTWADDPSLIADNARAKTLIAKIHREGGRAARHSARVTQRQRDRAKIEATGRVQNGATPSSNPDNQLERARVCPICRAPFSQLHHFYHAYCPPCAAFNWEKRHQSADLRGRIAIVTGGRIKIGFACALKLLRAGARVIVTTRFSADAERRYRSQSDYEVWRERLEIVTLDLKYLGQVERQCAHWRANFPHLDILINNAAQTIARPPQFYAHLLADETPPSDSDYDALTFADSSSNDSSPNDSSPDALTSAALNLNASAAPALSFGRLSPDKFTSKLATSEALAPQLSALSDFFPPNRFDADEQQIDLRPRNSWTARLGEVEALEAAQCYVVSALAPFVLTGELRDLMRRSPFERRFVVQASAMEGNFSRARKTARHPHTNMAKAALNMLVRTCAPDLQSDGIWCNAVDTGWITDENPHPTAADLRAHGFVPPLDVTDGAARLLDPIFDGLDETRAPFCGQFLKDYRAHDW